MTHREKLLILNCTCRIEQKSNCTTPDMAHREKIKMLDWTPARRTSGVKKTGRPIQMITTNGLNASIYA